MYIHLSSRCWQEKRRKTVFLFSKRNISFINYCNWWFYFYNAASSTGSDAPNDAGIICILVLFVNVEVMYGFSIAYMMTA
jgi:hypothetical protein